MPNLLKLMAILVLAWVPMKAHAVDENTKKTRRQDHWEKCLSKEPLYVSYCAGYVSGFVLAMEDSRLDAGVPPCIPDNVTVGEITDAVRAHIRANPYMRTFPVGRVMAGAIASKFCPHKGQ